MLSWKVYRLSRGLVNLNETQSQSDERGDGPGVSYIYIYMVLGRETDSPLAGNPIYLCAGLEL